MRFFLSLFFIAALLFFQTISVNVYSSPSIEQQYSECQTETILDDAKNSNNLKTSSITTRFKTALDQGSFLLPLMLALFAGLLTSLSPCVYPLIPITLSIMGTRKYDSHIQGFLMSSTYVAGMTLVYSTLGASFAYLGILAGSLMQHPAIMVAIAMLFALLALSMFGLFDLVVPQSILAKTSRIGGQGYRGAFLMGLVAGIIAAPCTGPVLGFILTLIAENQNILLGSTLMFAYSAGLGFPFLVLGTFSSAFSRMPKSGPWMNNVKFIFGAAMMGAAMFYLGLAADFINEYLQNLAALGLVFVITITAIGVNLLLIHPRIIHNKILIIAQRSAGATLAALGLATLLNAQGLNLGPKTIEGNQLNWHVINAKNATAKSFDNFLESAKSLCKPVMVDFYADWCVACKKLEINTFSDMKVKNILDDFFLIKVNSTDPSKHIAKLQNRFGVSGLPTILFFDRAGALLPNAKVLGFMSSSEFAQILNEAKKENQIKP